MYKKIQKRTYEILESADIDDSASKIVDVFLMVMIVSNIIVLMLESVKEVYSIYPQFFYYFELVSILIFSLEYLLRIWSIGISPKYGHGILDRFKFILSPVALIDLLAIIPFFLPFFGLDFRFLRSFRLLRLAKLSRYSKSLLMFKEAIYSKKDELTVSIVLLIVLLILSSCMMYFLEHKVQPDAFSNIPATMWWSIVTLTTVGYGDIAPITSLGKLVASIIAFLGIGLFTIPTALLSSAFMEQVQKKHMLKKMKKVYDNKTHSYVYINEEDNKE